MKVKILDPRRLCGYRIVNLNRRRAIAEKCLDCSGFIPAERRTCTITDCLLYPYRTGVGKQDSDARNRYIRAYCRETCMESNQGYVSKCTSPGCPLYAYRMAVVDTSVAINNDVLMLESGVTGEHYG